MARKMCIHPQCSNQAIQASVCRRHGAKTKRCEQAGCTNIAISGGVCQRHGANKKRCSYPGCPNISQRGGVCCRHGAKAKECGHPNCRNNAVKGGVCHQHGAKSRKCGHPYCSNNAVKGGICRRHGRLEKMSRSETEFNTYDSRQDSFEKKICIQTDLTELHKTHPTSIMAVPNEQLKDFSKSTIEAMCFIQPTEQQEESTFSSEPDNELLEVFGKFIWSSSVTDIDCFD